MNDLTQAKPSIGPLTADRVERVESIMLQLPQSDCPVKHRFGPGIYIREVFLPKGTLAVGHHHISPHMNVFLSGRLAMLANDGKVVDMEAPMTFVSPAGRKIAYIIEDSVWQNIYPNPDGEQDIEKLEARWLKKSQTFLANEAQKR